MRLPYLLIAVTVSLLAALPACTEEAAPAEKSEANGQIDPGADSEPVGETVATKSGLQITMLKEGTGPSPKASDRVEVHYHGTFEDGTVFDSSVDRGKTATFPLRRVIKCWTEGLQLMKVGGKARLVCPPNIAYGSRRKGKIPANSTLYFDVELIAIE
ncbi:MAG: FKBP-type peptidyl-prolyl cis-trans isomerase [Deltaproteobacteria bacterium]|nr:FKBP-type peptidyl-prolyl cis-trans isomerase [Deltaproteobacteria bacterium]MBW2694484.1 FKBP-type peptidyl-prolyl cis-trans isomerase [Deltaproteobacteria bacterium]